DALTNSTSVTLTLAAVDTSEMYVTNISGCGSGSSWEAYVTSKSWTLGQANTTATVYVKYKDTANNETGCFSDTITHDNTAPSGGTVSINGGATYTSSTSVTLTLSSTEAAEMYVSNTSGCGSGGSWEDYNASKSWTLGQANATATVYVKFRDTATNETSCYNDTIVHDNTAPTGTSISINGGETTTASTSVTLTLGATGASQMYITNTSGCAGGGTLESYATGKAWTLGQTNGTATVYVKYIDAAGNESTCVSDTIIHDNIGPTNENISINGGGVWTSSTSVTLTLSAVDASEMYVTNMSGCGTAGSWEAYSTSKAWTLGQSNDTAAVYVKYRDTALNESSCASDTISHLSDVPLGANGKLFFSSGGTKSFLVDKSGNIFVAGANNLGTVIAKYNINGNLITSFGASGFAVIPARQRDTRAIFNGEVGLFGLALQSDGKPVGVGSSGSGSGETRGRLLIARVTADGNPDDQLWQSGYGLTKERDLQGVPEFGYGWEVGVQSTGQIVVAPAKQEHSGSEQILRFDPTNGSLDRSFGNNGAGAGASGLMALQADDKIITILKEVPGGGQDIELRVSRSTPNGVLDTTFAGNGTQKIVVFPGGGSGFQLHAVKIGASGKIVVLGWGTDSNSRLYRFLVRLNPDGSVDSTFGTNGIKLLSYDYMARKSLAIQTNDYILLGSSNSLGGTIYRFNNTGDIDTSFGLNGSVFLPSPGGADYITVQVDEKILCIGAYDIYRFRSNGSPDGQRTENKKFNPDINTLLSTSFIHNQMKNLSLLIP
ncbi:MAG: hypothetical protein HQ462_09945, partial [Deltaproteobacteria bacterium]|nr:hypothetical protein [Deltaproteobacteria bacterium]